MAHPPRRALATLLVVAVLTAGCSSTLAGSATTGSIPPDAVTATSSGTWSSSSGSTADGFGSPGITSPSTRPSATAGSGEPDGAAGTIGDAGIGDPYYPLAGNGGYQVDSYDINLSYDPPSNALQSTATIKGSVTSEEGLSQFDLDLQPGMDVSAVTVNGASATFEHDGAELVVTPGALLPASSALDLEVTYAGKPDVVPGGTSGISDGGWYRTESGGAFVAGEPSGASSWYPVNEHPADTASFAVTATVPAGWNVISNGVRQTDGLPDPGPGKSSSRWVLSEPVASYLTTIYIDKFEFLEDTLPDGKPIVSAIAPSIPGLRDVASQTKQVINVLSQYFGPYPFEAAGGIFVGESTGFALETATRPIYSVGVDDLETVVHEISHQWYGDDVTIKRWSDICLNECFASYGPWLYDATVSAADLDAKWKQQMRTVLDRPAFWASPLVDMGPGEEFTRVYDRGPLAVHALRKEMGDEAFFALLKGWPATYGGKNASFDDFETYASTVAGRDLRPFIDAWFRGTTVPDDEFRYPGDLGD